MLNDPYRVAPSRRTDALGGQPLTAPPRHPADRPRRRRAAAFKRAADAKAAAAAQAAQHAVHEEPAHIPFQRGLIPAPIPVRFDDAEGRRAEPVTDDYAEPPAELLQEAYRRIVLERRFDMQATALTRQGRLAVYPSARGQDARLQVGARLGVGRLLERPWIDEGRLAMRPVIQLSFTLEHRVSNGGSAGFLPYVADGAGKPGALLAGRWACAALSDRGECG